MFKARDPSACLVCRERLDEPIASESGGGEVSYLHCPNCGKHRFTFEAAHFLDGNTLDSIQRAVIAHMVSKTAPLTLIELQSVVEWSKSGRLPDAAECVDRLVMLMAGQLQPGQAMDLKDRNLCARVGCLNFAALKWVVTQAEHHSLIAEGPRADGHRALTLNGWERHRQLLRNGAGSQHAFMAMQFGDAQLNAVFREHLVQAVAACGFQLRTVNGPHQTAGSIDDRMRVEIRTSRFLVCDLTHGNRGAYWEAGFAEGLGRPVFYVCRQDVLSDPKHPDRPHFDTRQQLIIAWDPSNPEPGMQALKDAIRATLPAEAKMQD